ncbi:MAG: hypothetical protein K2Q10_08270 [Rhodospirillales bacterium]|nr:hypothetical protein [Rhodospirillales bacterium]
MKHFARAIFIVHGSYLRLGAAKLRQQASPLIENLLERHGVEEYQVPNVALNKAVFNCAKDLEK